MRKNRVMIVVGSFKIGGAERMSINVGEELMRNGYDVHYTLLRPIFDLRHNIPKENIHLINKTLQQNKYVHHFRNFIGVFLFRLMLRPRTVIAFTYFSSFLACFTFSTNIIGRFDINPYHLKRKLRHRFANTVVNWPFVKRIVVPSQGLGEHLKRRNKKFEKKIKVINNSIDFDRINQMSSETFNRAGFNEGLPYIAAMGRLSHQKNYELLLAAYSKSSIREKMNLAIIGDGPFMQTLMDLAMKLGISRNVIFTGFMKNPFPIIKHSSLFINTSNFESFCNVILEALSLAVPVVASDCDFGPSEIVAEGRNGFMFETGNESQLVDILNRLAANPQILDDLKKNTVSTSDKFKLSEIGKQWIGLLNQYA